MAYLDNINTNSTDYAINSFANLLLASGGVTDAKTVTFPNGYDVTDGSNMTFRVLFPYGHNGQANMTLNGVDVVVNKYGTLIPLPYHNISSTYKSLQANTVLEMYYTSNYDGNNTPAFVIVGNPIVLSSDNYIIYADGKNVADTIYPVGSLYWSSKSTNPSTLFGGTWVQIKDRFVLACGDTYTSSGATGGASTVTLSVDNMPSHTHSFTPSGYVDLKLNNSTHTGSFKSCSYYYQETEYRTHFYEDINGVFSANSFNDGCKVAEPTTNQTFARDCHDTISFSLTTNVSGSATFTGSAGTTGSNGSGTSFSILPPYVVKYCWERTA